MIYIGKGIRFVIINNPSWQDGKPFTNIRYTYRKPQPKQPPLTGKYECIQKSRTQRN